MAIRPPQIRYLSAGKAIGAPIHKGWVATWNWVLSCINFFKGGRGLRISSKGNGHPVADVLIEGGEGIDVTCVGEGLPYVVALAGGGGLAGSPFHFAYSHSSAESDGQTTHTVTIGEGAVQLGGFTHFVSSGSVSGMASGTVWICVQIALSSGAGSFVAYQSTSALNAAQLDVTKYIFPIYKVTDYAVAVDYRPMPNAGVWEDETLVSVPSS